MKRPLTAFSHSLGKQVRSVRFRLMLWSLLMIAIILVGFSIFVYTQQARDVSYDSINRVNRMARLFIPTLHDVPVMVPHSDDTTGPSLGSLSSPGFASNATPIFQSYDAGALVDSNGQVLQKVGPVNDADLTSLAKTWQDTGAGVDPKTAQVSTTSSSGQANNSAYYFVLSHVVDTGGNTGTLIIGSPVDPDGRLSSLALNLVLGSVAVLFVTLVGGYWLAGRVMRPVQTITKAAQQISETDLRRRLNLGTKDELGELADTFDQMLGRLESAFDRQRQFTADASHELRTPLTIIELETERALERHRKPEEYTRALQVIQTENETMARLVSDLLTLARMDAGQTMIKTEQMDLSDIALEVVERLQSLASHRQIMLETGDLPEVPIRGDHQYMVQMLTNLVENALKYAGENGKTVHVETGLSETSSPAGGWVRVIDNGPGIPPEHLPHLFDRFYRVDKARTRLDDSSSAQSLSSATSSGLGLAIVQWIAQAHGGRVSVKSEVGQGSTFEVWLPISE